MAKNNKGAGAPKGNQNAVKWTRESATALFDNALSLSYQDEYDFIGLITKKLMVTRAILDYLKEKYPELQNTYDMIKENCETNCFQNAKSAKHQAIYILNLKSNHKWVDRVQTDNTNTNSHEIVWNEIKTYKDKEE